MLGLFHLKYKTPATDIIMKNNSTMLLYVIRTKISLVQSIIKDKIICKVKVCLKRIAKCIEVTIISTEILFNISTNKHS